MMNPVMNQSIRQRNKKCRVGGPAHSWENLSVSMLFVCCMGLAPAPSTRFTSKNQPFTMERATSTLVILKWRWLSVKTVGHAGQGFSCISGWCITTLLKCFLPSMRCRPSQSTRLGISIQLIWMRYRGTWTAFCENWTAHCITQMQPTWGLELWRGHGDMSNPPILLCFTMIIVHGNQQMEGRLEHIILSCGCTTKFLKLTWHAVLWGFIRNALCAQSWNLNPKKPETKKGKVRFNKSMQTTY